MGKGKSAGPRASDSTGGRSKKGFASMRSAATVKRLQMYRGKKVQDSATGKKVEPLQRKSAQQSTRVVPDRRWFGNTRTVGQAQLQRFREQVSEKRSDPYSILIKQKHLPTGLVKTPEKGKERRAHILRSEPFEHICGPKSQRKRPRTASAEEDDLYHLAERARKQHAEYESRQRPDTHRTDSSGLLADGERNPARSVAFFKGQSKRIWTELYRVIDSSDVVVQVLDARDPNGTRSAHLEHYIKHCCNQKHMVIILNKCDLVPSWATRRWLFYLSRSFPTLAFHASITNPFGKGALLSLLRQFGRLRRDRQSISVGFVGYPNVGKSSVINTLQSKKVCGVAPVPGETKVWQFLTLTKRVLLIDCPGVVYHREGDSDTDAVLKGVVRVTDIEDATEHVPQVLNRIKPRYLQRAYQVRSWTDSEDFLAQLARRSGKLFKGGEPDINTAAKTLLLDWQKGKIPFFELPDDEELDKLKREQPASSQTDGKRGPSEETDPIIAARASEASDKQIARSIPEKPAFFDGDDAEKPHGRDSMRNAKEGGEAKEQQQHYEGDKVAEAQADRSDAEASDDEGDGSGEDEESLEIEGAAQKCDDDVQADGKADSVEDDSEDDDGEELSWENIVRDIGK